MSKSGEILLKRVTLEVAIIVVGILLAFAIDAWWEDRQERDEEEKILLGLKNEFSRYRDELEDGVKVNSNTRLMVAELMAAARAGSWNSESIPVDLALSTLGDSPTHDFGGGILDAVISGGRLEIISDYELRTMLASWSQVFNEIRDDQERNRSLVQNHVTRYMLRWHVPQSRGLELCCSWSKWPQSTRSIDVDSAALTRLLTDREFEVLLEFKHIEIAHMALEYDIGLKAIDDILDAIDASLYN
ncbi:MAG: hypothetical protein HKO64_04020 [Xanthomonadales bacterium]|nr:hypothetical protein [Xanthomonadales bacterium]NNL94766.1 hypothetical protein [Xanthomonadales bacterium]